MGFHSRQSFSISFFHVSLGLPASRLPSICVSHAVLIAPLECSTCPNKRSLLSQNEIEVLKLSFGPYLSHFLWLDTAELSDHGPIIVLQALEVHLGQWRSFTGQEHGALQARAVYMATGLVREVAGCENW